MDKWNRFCINNRIQESYRNVTLKTQNRMKKEINNIAVHWICDQTPLNSLILRGATGRGKTYFLHCLMRGIISRFGMEQVVFFKSKTLDDRMLSDFRNFGTSSYIVDRVQEIPFLFLDDFGVERDGQRMEREYYDVIDERVANHKTTVISTNLTDKNILEHFGDRIHSRLKTFFCVEFDGPDLRGIL